MAGGEQGLQLCWAALDCVLKPFPSEYWEGRGGRVEVGVHAHCVGLSFPPNNVERFVYPPRPLHPFPLRAIYNALNSIAPGTQRQRGTMTWEGTEWFHLSSTPSIKTTDWLADLLQAPPHPLHTMVTPGLEKTLPRIVSPQQNRCVQEPKSRGRPPSTLPSPKPPHADLLAGDGVL